MKLKNFITVLCLLVLMFQVLPVKQLGDLLFSNQLQEEMPHTCTDDNCKDINGKLSFKKDFYCTNNATQVSFLQNNSTIYIHFASALPPAHASEIHLPPPNIA